MYLKNLGIISLIILLFSVILLPALGATIINLPEDDDLADDDGSSIISNYLVAWTRIPAYQMLSPLRFGISIFILFVVYLGGRSKYRRFNDRTIDHVNISIGEFLKAALIRAVFNFLFFCAPLFHTNNNLIDNFFPNLIPTLRR